MRPPFSSHRPRRANYRLRPRLEELEPRDSNRRSPQPAWTPKLPTRQTAVPSACSPCPINSWSVLRTVVPSRGGRRCPERHDLDRRARRPGPRRSGVVGGTRPEHRREVDRPRFPQRRHGPAGSRDRRIGSGPVGRPTGNRVQRWLRRLPPPPKVPPTSTWSGSPPARGRPPFARLNGSAQIPGCGLGAARLLPGVPHADQ